MHQTDRLLIALRERVAAEIPMFTLESTQRRADGLQHWRVSRGQIKWAVTSKHLREMDGAQWQRYEPDLSACARPSPATILKLQGQLKDLQPKALELFEQVTAPRRMMDAIHRTGGDAFTPQGVLASQMQDVQSRATLRLEAICRPWPRPMAVAAIQDFPTGETLALQLPGLAYTKAIEWKGTGWGMFEHLEAVVAQLARWERMCQAITREVCG